MRILVEITEEAEVQPIDGDTAYEKRKGWLHHWAIEYRLIEVKDDLIPVYYTVAIVEDYDTGQIFTYSPSALRILGKEIKE